MAVVTKKIGLINKRIDSIKLALENASSVADEMLELLYEEKNKSLSYRHFTPFHVAQKAVAFLVKDEQARILDIGSGNGKFCHVGSFCSKASFVGIEYKCDLVQEARRINTLLNIDNVTFHCANILEIEFDEFSGIYLFNPFLEQIDATASMDGSSVVDNENYIRHVQHVKDQLAAMKPQTRLVTYYYKDEFVPEDFVCKEIMYGGTLKFYIKEQ